MDIDLYIGPITGISVFLVGVVVGVLLHRSLSVTGSVRASLETSIPFAASVIAALSFERGWLQFPAWLGLVAGVLILCMLYAMGSGVGRKAAIYRRLAAHHDSSDSQDTPAGVKHR